MPNVIKNYLTERAISNSAVNECDTCNSHCCSGPGFAILENILEIYKLYQSNLIIRKDYEFKKGLNLPSFIYRYFDRVVFNSSLLVFFPKTFSDDYRIESIPPWQYYNARKYIQSRNEKKGCIFLSRLLNYDSTIKNPCILHNDQIYEQISSKPIDCIFLNCSSDKKVIEPTNQETADWFSMLNDCFPKSKERFNNICPEMPD